MSRAYGVIQTAFWTDERTRGLSSNGKLFAAYLLSGPHTNAIGCFRLPPGYVAEDLGWSTETVSETIAETVSKGFLRRCERTGFIFIRNFLRYNPIQNPNVGKSVAPFVEAVPRNAMFYEEFLAAVEPYAERLPKGLMERLRKPLPEGYAEPNPIHSEQKSIPISGVAETARAAPQPRGCRLPADWTLPDDWLAKSRAKHARFPEAFFRREAERFRNYWIAKPGKDGVKLDWEATWRNWVDTAAERSPANARASPSAVPAKPRNTLQAADLLTEEPKPNATAAPPRA